MVVGDAEPPLVAVHACREQFHLVAECGEQRAEGAVQFVAEAAPPASDQLVQQPLLLQHDLLAEVDRQVLEGHRPQMAQMQLVQCPAGGFRRALRPDPAEICVGLT